VVALQMLLSLDFHNAEGRREKNNSNWS